MKGQRRIGTDLPHVIAGVRGPREVPEADLSVSQEELIQRIEGRGTEIAIRATVPDGEVITRDIDVELIVRSPYQPRLTFTEEEIEELADSIQSIGLVRPIIVRPVGDKFELVGGERRWRAHKFVGLKKIRSEIRVISDDVARVMAVTDNEGQVDLTDFEKARAYKRIMDAEPSTSMRNIARRLSVNPGVMTRILQLNHLPVGVVEVLEKKPSLITKYRVKEFLDVAETNSDLVVEVVHEMAVNGTGQDEALKILAKRLKGPTSKPPVVSATIKGVGEMRLNGQTMSLKFPKGKDPAKMFAKVQALLAKISDGE